ncbi:MAG: AI-2E family transporter [Cyclobacteriaceae bacterium]
MPVTTSGNNDLLRVLQYTFFTVILLYMGKALFIPLSVALLISFILFPFCNWLEKRRTPRVLAIFIGLLVFFLIISAVVVLLGFQFAGFMKEWPVLSVKLNAWLKATDIKASESWIRVFIDSDKGLIGSAIDYVSAEILPLIPRTIYQSSVSLVLMVLIPVYAALILYYRGMLVGFVYQLFPKSAARQNKETLPNVILTYYNFIKGMGMVYLIVAILNSIGLAIIGIPNPIFFGFVASILTFIPYVGITIGALLPMAISWLKYDSIYYPIGVIAVFMVVQILEANVIFPLAVSRQLKINALITLIVIIAGGILWGTLGMILFIPFTAILKLIADQIDEMKMISILLGKNPDYAVEVKNEAETDPSQIAE